MSSKTEERSRKYGFIDKTLWKFKDSEDLLVIRDLTMILLSYAGFLRYDEISSLLCRDVKVFDDYLVIYINKSKTDQYRHGNEVVIAKGSTVASALNMFNRYVKCSDINLFSDGHLFRPIFRSKSVCKLIYKTRNLVIQLHVTVF